MDTLVIGCGPREVKQYQEPLVAVDISQEYLDKAKKIRQKNKYVLADAHKLPFKNSSFKKIYCLDVIEHVDNPKQVIKEIMRVTKKDAKIFLKVPMKAAQVKLAALHPVFKRDFFDTIHKHQFDRKAIDDLLKNWKCSYTIKETNHEEFLFFAGHGFFCRTFHLSSFLKMEQSGGFKSSVSFIPDILVKSCSVALIFMVRYYILCAKMTKRELPYSSYEVEIRKK